MSYAGTTSYGHRPAQTAGVCDCCSAAEEGDSYAGSAYDFGSRRLKPRELQGPNWLGLDSRTRPLKGDRRPFAARGPALDLWVMYTFHEVEEGSALRDVAADAPAEVGPERRTTSSAAALAYPGNFSNGDRPRAQGQTLASGTRLE